MPPLFLLLACVRVVLLWCASPAPPSCLPCFLEPSKNLSSQCCEKHGFLSRAARFFVVAPLAPATFVKPCLRLYVRARVCEFFVCSRYKTVPAPVPCPQHLCSPALALGRLDGADGLGGLGALQRWRLRSSLPMTRLTLRAWCWPARPTSRTCWSRPSVLISGWRPRSVSPALLPRGLYRPCRAQGCPKPQQLIPCLMSYRSITPNEIAAASSPMPQAPTICHPCRAYQTLRLFFSGPCPASPLSLSMSP